jgi:hypothetical protein
VIDELQHRVSTLEQQKCVLNATITKQTMLIKGLRNQRVSAKNNDSNKIARDVDGNEEDDPY